MLSSLGETVRVQGISRKPLAMPKVSSVIPVSLKIVLFPVSLHDIESYRDRKVNRKTADRYNTNRKDRIMSNQTPSEKIEQYLTDAGVFYFTTAENNIPHARPFSFHMLDNDTVYFGFGTFKDVYKQVKANSNVEVCAAKGDTFLRMWGKAEEVTSPELTEKAFEVMPFLKDIYNEETGNVLGIFKLTDATAQFRGMLDIKEEYRF